MSNIRQSISNNIVYRGINNDRTIYRNNSYALNKDTMC
jgi:hypothetical protein